MTLSSLTYQYDPTTEKVVPRGAVVLDLADIDEDAASSWAEVVYHLRNFSSITAVCIADQIEAQTRPAIEEPKGLGAVVEDREGFRWIRSQDASKDTSSVRPWLREDDRVLAQKWSTWDDLNVVRVLSEGVES